MKQQRAFHLLGMTLVEVMVAIIILAIAMGALGKSLGSSINAYSDLSDKLLAEYVARNKIAQRRLYKVWGSPGGNETGESTEYGKQFVWRETIKTTPNSGFLRIEIEVALANKPEEVLAKFIDVMRRP